ncbi:MAG: FeoB small GTPase domain-containing protein, partial [Pirellulaceae bacterium]
MTVALLGNPNTGKSTLFSALCGLRQRVGNYPGVTVEKKIGRTEFHGRQFAIVDLPGTYSLAPKSPDEMVAVDVLLGRQRDVAPPSVVLIIVDASNLERNFYLLSQVLELGLPTVVALNMVDVARRKGQTLDVERLRKQLAIPIVEVQANRGIGIADLKEALASAVDHPTATLDSPFPDAFR